MVWSGLIMLLKNERTVLQHLVRNARTNDLTIAKAAGISTQAVGKIRKKLEKEGIIAGYNLRLNPHEIGLDIVVVLAIQVPPEIIEKEDDFKEKIIKEPNIMDCYRLMHGGANFLIVFAFRNLQESEEYFKRFHRKYSNISIVNMQTSSWDLVWKNTKKDAYLYGLKNQPLSAPFETKEKKA
jgi:DNA-binding Lrp family transcriptional regulator